MSWGERAILRVILEVEVLKLSIATRREISKPMLDLQGISLPAARRLLENALHETGPVLDAGGHVPTKNPGKWLLVDPLAFNVVNFKLHVWWCECRHIGTKVVANYLWKGKTSEEAKACS